MDHVEWCVCVSDGARWVLGKPYIRDEPNLNKKDTYYI